MTLMPGSACAERARGSAQSQQPSRGQIETYCQEEHALAVHGAAHSQVEDRPSLYGRPCMSQPKDGAYFLSAKGATYLSVNAGHA